MAIPMFINQLMDGERTTIIFMATGNEAGISLILKM